MDLNRLAVVLGDDPDDLGNGWQNGADEAALPGTDEDAPGQAFDLILPDEARSRERPASRQLADVGADGLRSRHGRIQLSPKT